MILNVQRGIHEAIDGAIRQRFGVAEVPAFAVEVPPTRALGDLAVPVAFQLARALRKPPRAIAQELAGAVGAIPGVARIVAAPNGYLNLYLDRPSFLTARLRGEIAPDRGVQDKTIVEHTAINPNKAAHIGHLRNAALGDTHLRTMARLNIAYDLLTYEGDIVRLRFWAHTFEILKAQGAVFLQTEGKLAGCWVMRIDEGAAADDEAAGDEESREKVIVRSNGVVTYVGKDIANQFWKFGLLGRDFRYRRFATQGGGRTLWAA